MTLGRGGHAFRHHTAFVCRVSLAGGPGMGMGCSMTQEARPFPPFPPVPGTRSHDGNHDDDDDDDDDRLFAAFRARVLSFDLRSVFHYRPARERSFQHIRAGQAPCRTSALSTAASDWITLYINDIRLALRNESRYSLRAACMATPASGVDTQRERERLGFFGSAGGAARHMSEACDSHQSAYLPTY